LHSLLSLSLSKKKKRRKEGRKRKRERKEENKPFQKLKIAREVILLPGFKIISLLKFLLYFLCQTVSDSFNAKERSKGGAEEPKRHETHRKQSVKWQT